MWEGALITRCRPDADRRARFLAVGRTDGRLTALVFSPLGSEAISLISFRDASRKERKAYAKQV